MNQTAPIHDALIPYDAHVGRRWRPAWGALWVWPAVQGPRPQDRRDLLLHLPASYDASPTRRYPVVYAHDGQNLFDPALSYAGSWRVDLAARALAVEGREAIVVGIPNLGLRRLDEYSPFHDATLEQGGDGDSFLRFVVEQVKARVDEALRTQPGRETTAMLGASMGGLIGLYALFAQRAVFSRVAALSPSLFFADEALDDALACAAPVEGARVFLSHGGLEGRRDREGLWRRDAERLERAWRVEATLRARGVARQDLARVFAPRGGHDEASWAALLPAALRHIVPRT